MILSADALGPAEMQHLEKPLVTKFGPLTIVPFVASKGTPRSCLGFVRAYDNPRMQLSGWFCQGGTEFVEQSDPCGNAEVSSALESVGESSRNAARRALNTPRRGFIAFLRTFAINRALFQETEPRYTALDTSRQRSRTL